MNKNVILIVEDSDEDYYAAKRAFAKSGLANTVYRVPDGEQALDYLFHRGSYADAEKYPTPNVILLDLNLPKMDGRDVLEEIKKSEKFREIPVVVLTTSSDENDINRCYAAGANSYIQKPVSLDRFMESIQRLKNYWFEIVVLPKNI